MEIDVGRKNLAFGWTWLILAMVYGLFMQIKMRDPNWAGNPFELMNWVNHAAVAAYSYPRGTWRMGHSHWGILAIVNILYGMLIDRIGMSRLAKQAGSVLCIAGTALFSAGLFGAGFVPSVAILALPGFLCISLACVIQVAGWMTEVK